MALINCSECGESISDKAAACPKCGAPITTYATSDDTPVTTQLTGKRLKIYVAASYLLMIIGAILCFSMPFVFQKLSTPIFWYGVGMFAIGLIAMAITRIRIWWSHG